MGVKPCTLEDASRLFAQLASLRQAQRFLVDPQPVPVKGEPDSPATMIDPSFRIMLLIGPNTSATANIGRETNPQRFEALRAILLADVRERIERIERSLETMGYDPESES